MSSCIFCKIAAGELPGEVLYEDEHVIAFMDIMPVTKGHVLLIPKNHRENVYDLTSDEASHLFSVTPKLARAIKDTFNPVGMNLVQNNGAAAGQAVFHFHLHFVPRYDETDGYRPTWDPKTEEFPSERIHELAGDIQKHLQTNA
ncbi:HIT family protein [Sporosarcina sp. BI001-red]|uniref:HIT family protein n=1 Tax=Sporosarcina sp. BI001-red TaxID=2282866 RepID=UPI000E260D58|nr:HIT family protein [Sporosarcina sp. BI001-red]REB04726.1 HIT family protein [Sporosarcina sp. BI001-red]